MARLRILTFLLLASIVTIFLIGYIPTTTPPCSFNPDYFVPQSQRLLPIFKVTRFVQPNNQLVQATLKEILANKSPFENDLQAIRNWVAANIMYEPDPEKPPLMIRIRNLVTNINYSDYWRYPEETIKNRDGDCEDFAILLCSLLRAYGYSPDDVYVALGMGSDDIGHAFVALKEDGKWSYVEPQATRGWFNCRGWIADRVLNECRTYSIFNDRDFSNAAALYL